MTEQTTGPDLLTLAMRRAHAETAERREPEPPPDDDAPAADADEAVTTRS